MTATLLGALETPHALSARAGSLLPAVCHSNWAVAPHPCAVGGPRTPVNVLLLVDEGDDPSLQLREDESKHSFFIYQE
jgi:hypothetical protein